MELVRILERLHQRNVKFVLVGGLAAYIGESRSLTVEALIRAKQALGRPPDIKTVGYLKAIEGKKRHST